MTAPDSIGIGWRPSSVSGWGVYGTNLILELLALERNPVLAAPPHRLDVDPDIAAKLAPVFQRQEHLSDLLEKTGVLEFDFPVLHALRNDFQPALADQPLQGSHNIGVIFFEDTDISEEGLARARDYDMIVTGSTWNKEVLQRRGLDHVVNVFQGIDDSLFVRAPRPDTYEDRFVIFSGGKLEYRKAQDVVIAAFREFRENHPEALLMFAWANQWPAIMPTIANSPFVEGHPEVLANNELAIAPWLIANGLPEDSFIDLGMPANKDMPRYLAAADAAIFPNRCEPGTNLVAMEAMAASVPCLIAANTGQLDLIDEGNCYPLNKQTPVAPYEPYAGVDGWREPDVFEVVESLESLYADPEEARRRGDSGADFIRQFSWKNQIEALVGHIDDLYRS